MARVIVEVPDGLSPDEAKEYLSSALEHEADSHRQHADEVESWGDDGSANRRIADRLDEMAKRTEVQQ